MNKDDQTFFSGRKYEPKIIKFPFSFKNLNNKITENTINVGNINDSIEHSNYSSIKTYTIIRDKKIEDEQSEKILVYNTEKIDGFQNKSVVINGDNIDNESSFFDTKNEKEEQTNNIGNNTNKTIYSNKNKLNGMSYYKTNKVSISKSACDIFDNQSTTRNKKLFHKFSLREKLTNQNKLTHSTKTSKGNTKTSRNCNDLYQRGIEMMKKKERKYEEAQRKKSEEYKNYPFQPKTNKYYSHHSTLSHQFSSPMKNNILERQEIWKNSIEQKKNSKMEFVRNQEISGCTFKPKINDKIKENDIEFIKKHLFQIVNYVKKRQDFLLEKENNKKRENDSKKAYHPKKIAKYSRFNSASISQRNSINDFKRNENKSDKVCKIRNELGITSFFDNTNVNFWEQ